MVKGLKQTSSVVAIGFNVAETAINTFAQGSIDLNLSPLDREVFVVLSVNLDPISPDAAPGLSSATSASLTTTSQTDVQTLANSNCLAVARNEIRSHPAFVEAGAPFIRSSSETPVAGLDFIGIIATNDFFVQVRGENNTLVKGCSGKMYGFRAQADASIFSALVQSEVLSA